MSKPKFKRGETVTVLSRKNSKGECSWENNHVGGNAIITGDNKLKNKIDTLCYTLELPHQYSLLLLNEDGGPDRTCKWFEEKFLESYCTNVERGLKFLEPLN